MSFFVANEICMFSLLRDWQLQRSLAINQLNVEHTVIWEMQRFSWENLNLLPSFIG